MAIDCDDIPTDLAHSCNNPWGPKDTLWKYTQSIHAACPRDDRVHNPDGGNTCHHTSALTQAVCQSIAGEGWTYYPTSDIWNRLTMWVCQVVILLGLVPA